MAPTPLPWPRRATVVHVEALFVKLKGDLAPQNDGECVINSRNGLATSVAWPIEAAARMDTDPLGIWKLTRDDALGGRGSSVLREHNPLFNMAVVLIRIAEADRSCECVRPTGGSAVPKSLADLVRDKLDAGTLPHESPVKMWAGRGSSQPCTACEQPILKAQVEYEPQYDGRAPIRLHVDCHGLWQAERRLRGYLLDD